MEKYNYEKVLVFSYDYLALLLTACGQEDVVLPSDDNNMANSEVNNVGDDANNNNDEQVTEKIYYGQWQVEEYLATGPIYVLSDDKIEQLLCTNLIYAVDRFNFGDAVSQAPVY